MNPRSIPATIISPTIGAVVLISLMSGTGETPRPPVGARMAFELVAKAGWRPSHAATRARLAKYPASETQTASHLEE
jgi:hypothetical protein